MYGTAMAFHYYMKIAKDCAYNAQQLGARQDGGAMRLR